MICLILIKRNESNFPYHHLKKKISKINTTKLHQYCKCE